MGRDFFQIRRGTVQPNTYEAVDLRKILMDAIVEPGKGEPWWSFKQPRDIVVEELSSWVLNRRLEAAQQVNYSHVGGKHPLMCHPTIQEILEEAWQPMAWVNVKRSHEGRAATLAKRTWPGITAEVTQEMDGWLERLRARGCVEVIFDVFRRNPDAEMLRLVRELGLRPTIEQMKDAVAFIVS